ncbi:MAG: hypothetical protein JNL09_02650 [Anaerolineales bacterium]|nr:hypothetical protein [Anaerolineales bacterium]
MSCPFCHTSVVVPEDLRQTPEAAQWRTLVFDTFTSNENGWVVGTNPSDDYFTRLSQSIADGRYRWEALTRRASSLTTAWLSVYPVADFHLSVSCKHLRGSKSGSSCGVIFRVQDNRNCYWFHITDAQLFAISVAKDGEWQQLVDWKPSEAIKPYGLNQLDVIAVENHFTFFINGQLASEIEDHHFTRGMAGVGIEGYTVGDETAFDFIEFTLRAKR